ncbi:MAG: DUF427 domain-containing protein [Paracoccaceae bacterium]|nr:MAG: DUF427 domain-containing protein [Paracoccaceae bacterium]
MADHIRIRTAPGTWVVRAGGAILGESRRALELTEGSYPPVIYFPRADVAMAMLDRTDRSSTCPWKGQASYFSVVTPEGRIENAVWSYETPIDDVSQIAGHLAFYTDRVTVERLY